MAAFLGLDLFDPSCSDEPVASATSLEDLPSASSVLEQSRPPRSLTSIDLASRMRQDKDPVGTVKIRTRMASAHSEGDFSSLPPEPQQVQRKKMYIECVIFIGGLI